MRIRHLSLFFTMAFAGGFALILLWPRLPAVEESQARVCRAILPAIAAARADITVTQIRRAPQPNSVQIDYQSQEPDRPPRGRQVTCMFAEAGLSARATELVGVITERGRMSEASLFFLRRYWLDRADTSLDAPPPPAGAPLLGRVSPSVGYAIQQALAGLPLIGVTGLLATAYALVYGLAGRIVLSFGEFAALGAVGVTLGVALAQAAGVTAALPAVGVGLLFAAWITATWGAAAARLALAPMMRQPGQHVLIATVGLALAISEGIRLTQGHSARWLSPIWNAPLLIAEAPGFSVTTTPVTVGVSLAALAASFALFIAMKESGYGRAWRACADDALAAGLCGVDAGRIVLIACALACGVAGLSGFLLTLHIGGMGFSGGAVFGLKALVGAIVGGVGSVGGALVGGLLVGALEALWSSTMPIEWRDVAVFALLSLILIFRPGGFFGDGGAADKPQGRAM